MAHTSGNHQQSGTTDSCNAGENSGQGSGRKKGTCHRCDVWAAIAERKRKSEQEGKQRTEAAPKATKCRHDDGTDRTIAEIQAGTAEKTRKRAGDDSETQEAERTAKKRKDGTDRARGQTDMQAKEKEGDKPHDKATVPAEEGKATQKRKLCEYICPHCSEAVKSTVRTGQVDHRRKCGNRFRVQDGRTVAKGYVYVCPFCNGDRE